MPLLKRSMPQVLQSPKWHTSFLRLVEVVKLNDSLVVSQLNLTPHFLRMGGLTSVHFTFMLASFSLYLKLVLLTK